MQLLSTLRKFSADDLRGQFVVSRRPPKINWPSDVLDGWYLSAESHLPRYTVSMNGHQVGWLLGRAVCGSGDIISSQITLPEDGFENVIYGFGGRFIFILPGIGRIYPDSCALLSAVFSKSTESIASTGFLLPDEALLEFREELVGDMRLPHKSCMFPLGMTAWEGVERILPNHYLNLQDFRLVRHWPNGILPAIDDINDVVDEVAGLTRRHLLAFLGRESAALQLTAGRDSRMLLACARGATESLNCVLADCGDNTSGSDISVGRRLARVAGCAKYEVIPHVPPTKHYLDLWLFSTGLGVGEVRGWQSFTAFKKCWDPSVGLIYGSAGELARAFYWTQHDTQNSELTSEEFLQRSSIVRTSEAITRVEEWRAGLADESPLFQLDLYYLEQRLGCWLSPLQYAGLTYLPIFPFAQRRTIELMLRLPDDVKRAGSFAELLIDRTWPMLNRYPFNPMLLRHKLVRESKKAARRFRAAFRSFG